MPAQRSFQVAGVDGCKAGWVVAIVEATKDGQYLLEPKRLFVEKDFTVVLSATEDCDLVCVDIPIGLSNGPYERDCDLDARKRLGEPRRRSVFRVPIRQCLSAEDYTEANKISLEHSGKKLSRQSFLIMDKIRQVDTLITPALQQRVREIHPEILFWALNNKKPIRHNKRKFAGRNERMKLLTRIFLNVEEIVAEAREPQKVAPDDVLDALAAAWTASQIILRKTQTLPEKPQFDSKDLRMEIVYPA
jgi:predicted RNase H-like nuclease